jgi:molybdate transport system substrate-binding protein
MSQVGRTFRIAAILLLALLGLFGGTVAAQDAFACETMAPPAAAAAPEATPAAAEVAFPADGGTLTIFAAASLTDAFGEFSTTLENENPGLDIVIETGGSQALVTQLQEGASADVLATANTSTMATAVESGLIDGDPVTFTGNRLVIVAPEDNPAGIASLDDLASDGVNLVLANESVPAGNYARQAICAYGETDAAAEGFVDTVLGNVVSEEEDVRNVLAKVQLGEADAGIVYASDATASALAGTPLTVIEFPAGVPVSATYPIAAVNGGNAELANAFIGAMLSPAGQDVLAKYGFAG